MAKQLILANIAYLNLVQACDEDDNFLLRISMEAPITPSAIAGVGSGTGAGRFTGL